MTNIVIKTRNSNTHVLMVNNVPYFGEISEPTLSILQAAFDAGDYEIIPDPEPIETIVTPNWDGLYTSLMSSSAYTFLLITSGAITNLASALGVVIDSIQYGIIRPDSQAALPAFQSAIQLLLMTMNNLGSSFSAEQLAEVRSVLDVNGFQSITLG